MKLLGIAILLFALAGSIIAQAPTAEKVSELGSPNCEEFLASMDGFLIWAANDPTVKLYFVLYDGQEYVRSGSTRKLVLPQAGAVAAKIASIKKYVSKRSSNADQFVYVNGGIREHAALELWRVPAGAAPPVAKPELTKIKHRKGKAKGFCVGCC